MSPFTLDSGGNHRQYIFEQFGEYYCAAISESSCQYKIEFSACSNQSHPTPYTIPIQLQPTCNTSPHFHIYFNRSHYFILVLTLLLPSNLFLSFFIFHVIPVPAYSYSSFLFCVSQFHWRLFYGRYRCEGRTLTKCFSSTRLETRTKESNMCECSGAIPQREINVKVRLRTEVGNESCTIDRPSERFECEHTCWDPKDPFPSLLFLLLHGYNFTLFRNQILPHLLLFAFCSFSLVWVIYFYWFYLFIFLLFLFFIHWSLAWFGSISIAIRPVNFMLVCLFSTNNQVNILQFFIFLTPHFTLWLYSYFWIFLSCVKITFSA